MHSALTCLRIQLLSRPWDTPGKIFYNQIHFSCIFLPPPMSCITTSFSKRIQFHRFAQSVSTSQADLNKYASFRGKLLASLFDFFNCSISSQGRDDNWSSCHFPCSPPNFRPAVSFENFFKAPLTFHPRPGL